MDYSLVSTRTISDETRSKAVLLVVESLSDREPDDVKCPLFDPAAFLSVLLKLKYVFIMSIIQG